MRSRSAAGRRSEPLSASNARTAASTSPAPDAAAMRMRSRTKFSCALRPGTASASCTFASASL